MKTVEISAEDLILLLHGIALHVTELRKSGLQHFTERKAFQQTQDRYIRLWEKENAVLVMENLPHYYDSLVSEYLGTAEEYEIVAGNYDTPGRQVSPAKKS